MNSEQPPILSGYNLWELMVKEVRRPGEKEEAQTVTEILKQPDNNEEVNSAKFDCKGFGVGCELYKGSFCDWRQN